MKQKITKQISYWLGVIVVGVALGLALQFVRAWTEPTADPPGGNVGAPLNTSENIQVKSGSLGINASGMGSASTQGLDVGGKAVADDFCLRGDSSQCLSNATNDYCFTYECGTPTFNGSNYAINPHCQDFGGERGYCPNGLKQKRALGGYGYCKGWNATMPDHNWMYPPGGSCASSARTEDQIGNAYVCCAN